MKHGIIDYEVTGSGEPVLIIHGWGIDRTTMMGAFEPVFNRVDGYRRYYIDLPGMGRSEHGDVKNSDDMLELLYDFATKVIGESFMIIGQSYGGLLVRGFVNKYPELIKKIILLCPCIIPGDRKGRVEPLKVLERDENLLSSLTQEEYDNFTLMNVLLTQDVWERYKEYLLPALQRADWDFLNNVLEGSFSFDVDILDGPCEIPTLIIAGKQDSIVGYKDQFELMEKYINSTYCAVDRAGHNLQIEQPEIFEDIVENWLKEHKDRG
ncbi:Pimeloyl-ACP methyl ester carboxylesterase [Ruminococcaceae bacterium KH2T8]|nr:Pimeloyl-ACP methyl ester carboxylesterase [Ruminococcaceae bacterium KH2T8]